MNIDLEPAEVIHRQGRYWLCVAGVYVAMETDLCRDPLYNVSLWDKASLDKAAEHINDGVAWRLDAARQEGKAQRNA